MALALYLVTRGDTGILVKAPNAGLAYEQALGYGFPFTRTQGTQVTHINPEGRRLTLNTIRSKGSNDDRHDSAPRINPGSERTN